MTVVHTYVQHYNLFPSVFSFFFIRFHISAKKSERKPGKKEKERSLARCYIDEDRMASYQKSVCVLSDIVSKASKQASGGAEYTPKGGEERGESGK